MTDEKKWPRAHEAKLNEAAANPGTVVDLGDVVVCDSCATDYRDRPESGGFIFESKAICPTCAPRWMSGIRKYREEAFIRAVCPPSLSFWRFVLEYRRIRGSNHVRVLLGDDALRAFGLKLPKGDE